MWLRHTVELEFYILCSLGCCDGLPPCSTYHLPFCLLEFRRMHTTVLIILLHSSNKRVPTIIKVQVGPENRSPTLLDEASPPCSPSLSCASPGTLSAFSENCVALGFMLSSHLYDSFLNMRFFKHAAEFEKKQANEHNNPQRTKTKNLAAPR